MLEAESREAGVVSAVAWARMHDLCGQEADALDQALHRLAERWPLTQPAAVAFQEWGAHLVKAMRSTAQAAAANGRALDAITHDIDYVRRRVAELVTEAQEFQRVQDHYGSEFANRIFHERYIGGDAWPPGSALPWQTGLDVIAQQLIANLEVNIDTNATRFVVDEPYKPPSLRGVEPGETWTPYVEPSTQDPPITPFDHNSWRHSTTVLDSMSAPPGSTAGGVTASGDVPGNVDAWAERGSFVDTPVGRVLGPGGVIGAPTIGGPVHGSSNLPVTGRPAGSGVVPMVSPTVAAQAGGRSSPAPQRRTHRGLRSRFEIPEGLPAVLMPPEESPSHDPGPGVIGIDR